MNAETVFRFAFRQPREPRSLEYQAGVLAALRWRFGEAADIDLPYAAGTTAADAYQGGLDEGHRRAKEYLHGDAA